MLTGIDMVSDCVRLCVGLRMLALSCLACFCTLVRGCGCCVPKHPAFCRPCRDDMLNDGGGFVALTEASH